MVPVFDIECVGWTNPIAVGFFDGFEYHEFIRENEEDDVVWRFLEYLRENFRGKRIYAHYASRYDNKILLPILHRRGEVALPEAGLIKLRWKEPDITFEDSYQLIPMSLKEATKMFDVEEKGEWPHAKNLKPWEMGEQLSTFRQYLKTDCLSLSKCIFKFCELIGTNFGVMPSITLPTTATKAFGKCFYRLDDIYPNEEFEEFIRAATFGARNEVYRRYGENIHMYDINFMYVSCYDVPIPIGRLMWSKPNLDEGVIAEADVKVPTDLYVGPLPHRIGSILTFPVGEFRDWWDMRELRNAIDNFGCDVIIRRQLNGDESPIMDSFGKFISNLRSNGYDELWKIFGVSVTGKFGQARWRDQIRYFEDIEDFAGHTPIDEDELYFQAKEYVSGRAPYIKPTISMRIRAETRIRHLKSITDAMRDGHQIFYGDTDSIFTTNKLPTGSFPGELKHLGMAERGYFIKQKLYATIQKGRLKQRSSGYSDWKLSEDDFKDLLEGRQVDKIVEEFPSVRTLVKGRALELLERRRRLIGDTSRNRVTVGLDTEPICLPLQPRSKKL